MIAPRTGQRSLLWLAPFLASLLHAAAPLRAQESLADLAPFRDGCQALADERFGTAATHFRTCWELLEDSATDGPEGNFVAARLLEALVKDGAASAAVAWYDVQEGFSPTPPTSYWIAVALQDVERHAEAADAYQLYLAATPDAPASAVLNRAICLSRAGRHEAAYELTQSIPRPTQPAAILRHAQIAAAAGRTTEALAFLPSDISSDPAWAELRLPLARLRGHLLWQLGDRDAAFATVAAWIDAATIPEEARQGFLLLEILLDGGKPAALAGSLDRWKESPGFPGREAARLWHLLLLAPEDRRSADLQAFAGTTTDPALRAEAALHLGAIASAGIDSTAADAATLAPPADLPPDLRERLDFAAGSRAYLGGRFAEAASLFSRLAEQQSGSASARQLFNAAVASLRGEDAAGFAAFEEALARGNPRSGYLADLSYLGGLYLAAKGDPAAFDRLGAFVQEHPDHPANIEARLALAEIHLNQAPARPSAARGIFEQLRTRPLSLAQSERLEYNSVWVELTEGDANALLRQADEFVANWPGSRYLGEVLMILAHEQASRKNHPAAATAFRRVADEFPDSPHAETARFFAARNSSANEETIAAWRRLIDAGGPLAEEAAHELGLLFLSLDRFDEARAELTALLDRLDETAPLRFPVMADLAYASYLEALATGRDAGRLTEAADRFAALSGLARAPALWRYHAAVRRGKCLEALGKSPVALEIYRSIVDETRSDGESAGDTLDPEETEWVFRAGFAAIDLLNAEKNWRAAIEVADALSEKSSPRAIEATRLAEKLRLKHWVWD